MVASKKISPNRRRSIAAPTQDKPSLVPKNRRRAHSIAPGASLSPFSKARRSLVPRKSILKSSVVPNVDPASQQSTSILDDHTSIRSMDATQDPTTPVHDDTTRLGRRVSWCDVKRVKTFSKHKNSLAPQSSVPQDLTSTNENDYPGQASRRRRSSVRYSIAGSEDMDMTTVIKPGSYLATGSAILDEEFDYDDDDDDMEITEAIQGNIGRRRSASIGRRPLSQLRSLPENNEDLNESQSDIGTESMEQSMSEADSQSMEFTIPLGQSLWPAKQDSAWLALKQMTHSGDQEIEVEHNSDDSVQHQGEVGMDLEDAMERLRRARDSLPLSSQPTSQPDDTFSSTEDSFEDDIDDGNKTLNLSRVIGRLSIGTNERMSIGYQDSNMDESEIYGNIAESTQGQLPQPSPSNAVQEVEPDPVQQIEAPVFQPPSTTVPATSGPSVFTRPVTPSKVKQSTSPSKLSHRKPTFSAAFALPVTKPSPKKPVTSPSRIPAKRPRTTNDDNIYNADAGRPAKKPILADKWMEITAASKEVRNSPQPANTPKQLSPSKKAIFQTAGVQSSAIPKPPNGTRRPSGYFARRKSLAAAVSQPSTSQSSLSSPNKGTVDSRRLSIGSAPSTVNQFDKHLESRNRLSPNPSSFGEVKIGGTSGPILVPVIPDPDTDLPESQELELQNDEIFEQRAIPMLDITPPIEDSSDIISQGAEINVEATHQWRDAVQQDEYIDEEEPPTISISQFFQMTGIKYMDELAAPRRSLHPGVQPIPQSRNVSDIPLAEFVTAMAIDVPQLDLYSRVSRDLGVWIEKSKIVFAQAEVEAAKVTPELFIEYARADEVGREELGHQLTLIRTHTRYLARSDWYDWKLQWVEGLRHTAGEAFKSLEDDARALEVLKGAADAILPELEKEYEQVVQELEQEQTEVEEIESCDQDYLNELKASIAEQNIEIEALKAELAEALDHSHWVQEKLQEAETQKTEAQATKRTAERVLQMKKTSIRSEVFRLKAELETLEDLHMLRITKVSAHLFEYVYASIFLVSIPCVDFCPIMSKVRITRFGKGHTRYKDEFPKLSTFFLACANYVINEGDDMSVREIVNRLSDFWSACTQLRSQLVLLKIKYPVDILVSTPSGDSPPYFKAKARVLFPSVQAKAFVYFIFSFDTLTQWPLSLGSLNCEVEVAYGPVERPAILKAVTDRLGQVAPAETYACLLDACIEAQDVYH